MYLLDTNSCIDFLLGRSLLLSQRMERAFGDLAVSAISAGELRVGSRASVDRVGDLERIDVFLSTLKLVAFDADAARTYGDLGHILGVRRSSFDRLIAAHALTLNATLVTNNERDFADIPDLRIENWTR